MNLNLKCF